MVKLRNYIIWYRWQFWRHATIDLRRISNELREVYNIAGYNDRQILQYHTFISIDWSISRHCKLHWPFVYSSQNPTHVVVTHVIFNSKKHACMMLLNTGVYQNVQLQQQTVFADNLSPETSWFLTISWHFADGCQILWHIFPDFPDCWHS